MIQSYNQLEFGLDIVDSEIDGLDADGDAGVDSNDVCDVRSEVDLGLEVVNVEFDAADGEVGDVEEDVGWG